MKVRSITYIINTLIGGKIDDSNYSCYESEFDVYFALTLKTQNLQNSLNIRILFLFVMMYYCLVNFTSISYFYWKC